MATKMTDAKYSMRHTNTLVVGQYKSKKLAHIYTNKYD